MRVSRIDKNPEKFKEAVLASKSFVELMKRMGYKYSSGMHKFLKLKMTQYGLDSSHMTGQGWAKGRNRDTDSGLDKMARRHEKKWEDCFRLGSNVHPQKLFRRLIRAGKKEYKCEICGLTEWMGKPAPLQLHHKNGNNVDNREENLEVRCSNCHDSLHDYGAETAALSRRIKVRVAEPADARARGARG